MELALIIAAITYMVTGKYDKEKAEAAYKAGKEPPSVVKARRKWESGGGAVSASGTPKGPGATRLALSHRWANACEKSKDKADDKHRRWRQWFADNADSRDQKWRERQTNKIIKSEKRAETFARARGLMHPLAARQERQAWTENARRDATEQLNDPSLTTADAGRPAQAAADPSAAQPDSVATPQKGEETTEAAEPQEGEHTPNAATAAAASISTQSTATSGGSVYTQAAEKLSNHADELEGYTTALAQLSDDMGSVGWGDEVTSPLADMRDALDHVSGIYRDLAEQIKAEGDRVNDAYDAAPWAPDKPALV